jgi:hypothetical protein
MRPIDTILADIKKYKDLCALFDKLKAEISKYCHESGIEFFFHQHLGPKEFYEFMEANLSKLRNELAKARNE